MRLFNTTLSFLLLTCWVSLVSQEANQTDWQLPLEDAEARAALPEFKWIAAAARDELTPGDNEPVAGSFTTWTRSHGDNGARRYSALTQINRENIHQLEVAWTYHSNDGKGNIQCNPIVVDGIIYAPTVGYALVALDGATGEELWRYQVPVPERLDLSDPPARRGLLYWPGDAENEARIIFTSGDWIYALRPRDGSMILSFGAWGRAYIPTGGTVGGVVYNNILIKPGLEGDIFGYDVRNGKMVWRFNTIPQEGEYGAETWLGNNRDGAHCWGGMSLDDQRGIAYFAVGAPRTDFIGVDRLGDNLFSNCLLALDATTGERLWHFQHVQHDIWDMDLPAPPALATIEKDGKKIAVVACITKTGETLLLDRVSGKPIFPYRMRRAPASTLPGEITAPYQPDITLPEPFAAFEFKPENVTDRSVEARDSVMKVVENATYGFYAPHELDKPTLFGSSRGGGEWTGVSIDMETGYMYVNSNHLASMITVVKNTARSRDDSQPLSLGEIAYQKHCMACHGQNRRGVGTAPPLLALNDRYNDNTLRDTIRNGIATMPAVTQITDDEITHLLEFLMDREQAETDTGFSRDDLPYTFQGYRFLRDHEGYPGIKPPWGTLNCLDLNTGKIVWSVPLGEYPKLAEQGLKNTGSENFGGATVTAGGIVFCAGTADEKIRAFDKFTGEELWQAKLPWGGMAPPTTYKIDGKQYVVIAASGGGKVNTPQGDAYVAFALP